MMRHSLVSLIVAVVVVSIVAAGASFARPPQLQNGGFEGDPGGGFFGIDEVVAGGGAAPSGSEPDSLDDDSRSRETDPWLTHRDFWTRGMLVPVPAFYPVWITPALATTGDVK
jgi:hypothetical protein